MIAQTLHSVSYCGHDSFSRAQRRARAMVFSPLVSERPFGMSARPGPGDGMGSRWGSESSQRVLRSLLSNRPSIPPSVGHLNGNRSTAHGWSRGHGRVLVLIRLGIFRMLFGSCTGATTEDDKSDAARARFGASSLVLRARPRSATGWSSSARRAYGPQQAHYIYMFVGRHML